MILSAVATFAIAGMAMLPGLLLLRSSQPKAGQLAAAATASLVAMMLATALLGEAVDLLLSRQLPALTILPVSILAIVAIVANSGIAGLRFKPIEWQSLAVGAIFLGYGFYVQAIAVEQAADGALLVHGWYNADWFKHLGHVSALANYGVPARDIFNQAGPLHYYWLSYILPGAGAAAGGDNWAALNAANSIVTLLFGSCLYGIVRMSGAGRVASCIAALLALFVSAPIAFVGQLISGIGFEGLMTGPGAPKGPALMTLSQYIPQHALTLTILLGWVLLDRSDSRAHKPLILMALAALAAAMTVSTLLGAMVLGVYGLLQLWRRGFKAMPEVAAMAVVSGVLVVLLGVVQIGNPASAIASPLLTNPPVLSPWHVRAFDSLMLVTGNLGLPLLLAIVALRYWKPEGEVQRSAWKLAVVLIAVGLGAAIVAEIALTSRLAIESRIRAINLPGIGIAIVGGWALAAGWSKSLREKYITAAVAFALIAIALPSAVVRTIWHGRIGDHFTTRIPADDREALAFLRENSAPHAVLFQYPEPPVLAPKGGGDAWGAIFGGRAVTASLRATDYSRAAPRIQAAQAFFSGAPVGIPVEADWIYLSRVLHPAIYDNIRARLAGDPAWTARACYEDACLFERNEGSK